MSLGDDIAMNKKAYTTWLQMDASDNSEDIVAAKRALSMAIREELTDVQRSYVTDYFIHNMNMVEIAQKYGVNKSTVSRTVNRGLHKLFKVLRYSSSTTMQASLENIKAVHGRKTARKKSGA